MVAAYLSSGLSQLVSSTVLLILFALLMLVIGAWMLLSKPPSCRHPHGRGWLVTALSGAGVGVLTGFLGVGGGFLIVPALVMFVGLPIRQAVGTSLVVIAMNSLAGVLGHLGEGSVDLIVVGIFVTAGLAGSLAGSRLAQVIKPEQLRTSFAVFVVLLGLFLLYDNLQKLGWRGLTVTNLVWDWALLGGVLIGSAATLLALNGGCVQKKWRSFAHRRSRARRRCRCAARRAQGLERTPQRAGCPVARLLRKE
jgi:hypothetical protein